MRKMSLLDMVQDILSDMDSDEVNSIDDTTESLQVAQIIKTCYYEMLDNRNWPHMQKLIQLDHGGSLSQPNYLKLPDSLKELSNLEYLKTNKEGSQFYKPVSYKHPDEFLSILNNRRADDPNVQVVTDNSGVTLRVYKNEDPMYWTSFDDTYIVTDSYNKEVDDTLKRSKTQCIAFIYPSWSRSDDFIPDLPAEAFSALLEEAKSTCFLNLKQMPNQKAEQKAMRQQRWLSRKAWRSHGGVRYPDYGRKSGK